MEQNNSKPNPKSPLLLEVRFHGVILAHRECADIEQMRAELTRVGEELKEFIEQDGVHV